jgi:hypothetical protein
MTLTMIVLVPTAAAPTTTVGGVVYNTDGVGATRMLNEGHYEHRQQQGRG